MSQKWGPVDTDPIRSQLGALPIGRASVWTDDRKALYTLKYSEDYKARPLTCTEIAGEPLLARAEDTGWRRSTDLHSACSSRQCYEPQYRRPSIRDRPGSGTQNSRIRSTLKTQIESSRCYRCGGRARTPAPAPAPARRGSGRLLSTFLNTRSPGAKFSVTLQDANPGTEHCKAVHARCAVSQTKPDALASHGCAWPPTNGKTQVSQTQRSC